MVAAVGRGLGPELRLAAAHFCTEFFIFQWFYKVFLSPGRGTEKALLVQVLHFSVEICAAPKPNRQGQRGPADITWFLLVS